MPLVTPLEVLRNHFGELPSKRAVANLSLAQLDDLGERLSESADVSVSDQSQREAYYGGGWLGEGWHLPVFKQQLFHALLYYPRLLVHDPLADFFSDRHFPEYRPYRSRDPREGTITPLAGGGPTFADLRSSPEHASATLSQIVSNLRDLAPLIDSGVLVLRSQWPTIWDYRQRIQTSVRRNLRTEKMLQAAKAAGQDDPPVTVWDNRRGAKVIPSSGVRPSDEHLLYQEEFFYLAKTLAVANQLSARYVPQTDADYRLLTAYADEIPDATSSPEQPPGKVLQEVIRLTAPTLDLDPKLLNSMRATEESFEDWRLSLRRIAREGSRDERDEFAQRVEEELTPRVHALKTNLSRRRALAGITPDGLEVAFTAGLGAVMADNPTGAIAALPGALKWVYNAVKKSTPGDDTVLARLVQR